MCSCVLGCMLACGHPFVGTNNALLTAGQPVRYQRYTNNEFVLARVLGPLHKVSGTALCMSAMGMNKSMMHH